MAVEESAFLVDPDSHPVAIKIVGRASFQNVMPLKDFLKDSAQDWVNAAMSSISRSARAWTALCWAFSLAARWSCGNGNLKDPSFSRV